MVLPLKRHMYASNEAELCYIVFAKATRIMILMPGFDLNFEFR